jgi:hypothetical protein
MSLLGRRIHVAGSASRKTSTDLISQAQEIVRLLTRGALAEGATLVVQAGPEPRLAAKDDTSPELVFDWTVMEEAFAALQAGAVGASVNGQPLIFAASSEKADADMPPSRRDLWDCLIQSGAVRLERIRAGSRSGEAMRALQAREGTVLVTLGGGAGVEHLAESYALRRRAIVPLDSKIGASRDDGTLGGEGLNRLALTRPTDFFRLRQPGTEAARLHGLSTGDGTIAPEQVAARALSLLQDLVPPQAFFVRLVNRKHDDFPSVESFFRDVVEPIAAEFGYQRHEVGTDEPTNALINAEVFEELHYSTVAIVDVTGERPNCCIELGYALRGDNRVLLTAKQGTTRPFDANAIPCHFWQGDLGDQARRADFREHWLRCIDLPPLVRPRIPF